MNPHNRVILLCDCKSPQHILELESDDDPDDPGLTLWLKLNHYLLFRRRVVNAVRYVLNLERYDGDFDTFHVRDVATAQKIIDVCQNFIDAMNHRLSAWERKQQLAKVVEKIKYDQETLSRWAARLASMLRRTEDDIIENGLRAENFTADFEIVFHMEDGSVLAFSHAFDLADDDEIVVFTEHNGHHSFPQKSVKLIEHRSVAAHSNGAEP